MLAVNRIPTDPPADNVFAPPEDLALLQGEGGVTRASMPDGQDVWLITKYEHVRAVLQDRRFSANPAVDGYPAAGGFGLFDGFMHQTMQRKDPPDHARLRKMLAVEFAPRSIDSWQGIVDRAVSDAIEDLKSGPSQRDVIDAFCRRVPTQVTGDIFGVPERHHQELADCALKMASTTMHAVEGERVQQRFIDIINEIVEAEIPEGTLLLRLKQNRYEGARLTDDEFIAATLHLLVAGLDTTSYQLAFSILTLLAGDHGVVLEDLDSTGWAQLVEELLRVNSIVRQGPRRVALEDVTVGDVSIGAGDGVFLSLLGANHDPDTFQNPTEVQLGRKSPHMSFGFGVHQCLGQSLARVELQAALREFHQAFPNAQLVEPVSQLEFTPSFGHFGPRRMDVELY